MQHGYKFAKGLNWLWSLKFGLEPKASCYHCICVGWHQHIDEIEILALTKDSGDRSALVPLGTRLLFVI